MAVGRLVRAVLLFGLAVAMIATRTLTRFLYQVAPFDPASIAAAIGIVLLLAMLAAFLPGWRAAKTDPARVLADGSQ